MRKSRWAIFISGQGSNMSALLDLNGLMIDVGLVVSSRAEAYGLLRARRQGVPTLVLDKKPDWSTLLQILQEHRIDHIFLLGFMKVIPVEFLKQWKKTILNVHPSLLPQYPGLKSIERAYQDHADIGVSVHHVVTEVDGGSCLFQKKVLDAKETSSQSLADVEFAVHLAEYALIRKAVERVYA